MLNFIKSKFKKKNELEVMAYYASAIMTVAQNPQLQTHKPFIKIFMKAQREYFEVFNSGYFNYEDTPFHPEQFDLTQQRDRLIISAYAVLGTAIAEDDSKYDEETGIVNCIKQEANLNRIPRAYADAFIQYCETNNIE